MLPLHKVLDDLDESEVQERRRHEGEFKNIQQAEGCVNDYFERKAVRGADGRAR